MSPPNPNPPQIPETFGRARIVVLLASLLAAVAAGTNYLRCMNGFEVFSAYGPQLGARLGISHTQLNFIGLGGNVGVYVSAPIWGKIVDSRGPKSLLLSGFVLLLAGYSGIRLIYDAGLPANTSTLSTAMLALLIACSFMTGVGGNGGLAAAINTTAKTFPDTSFISGFGLSAFLFSAIAHLAFPGNTSSFLLLLSIGTSFPMLIGVAFVRPIPLHASEAHHEPFDIDHAEADAASLAPSIISTPINTRALVTIVGLIYYLNVTGMKDSKRGIDRCLLQLRRITSLTREQEGWSSVRREACLVVHVGIGRAVLGGALVKRFLFVHNSKLFFEFSSILFGMNNINNVGSMAQALYTYRHLDNYNEIDASQWQATQVSTIQFHELSLVVCLLVAATHIENVGILWRASALLGLGYGSMFSFTLLRKLGIPLPLSPLRRKHLSVLFGRNLDAHERDPTEKTYMPPPSRIPPRQCLQGLPCYVDSLYLTIGACAVAMVLSVWAAWRDRNKAMEGDREGVYRRLPEVIWEEEEEDRED
ncbi:hypothetical protein BT96DRAFT_971416 [Gymnopus androsaceus JB14]|uniref:Nodulin-like domain-containing protein n=1 Tax=Gymnopus androsaceus JB14 TaxID=1447944 RepID=A0A6A4ID35_9AGAR|nr:hypothetical protein BT96DRAFT_971416 [Gymnopus androsaceus JB14]